MEAGESYEVDKGRSEMVLKEGLNEIQISTSGRSYLQIVVLG